MSMSGALGGLSFTFGTLTSFTRQDKLFIIIEHIGPIEAIQDNVVCFVSTQMRDVVILV